MIYLELSRIVEVDDFDESRTSIEPAAGCWHAFGQLDLAVRCTLRARSPHRRRHRSSPAYRGTEKLPGHTNAGLRYFALCSVPGCVRVTATRKPPMPGHCYRQGVCYVEEHLRRRRPGWISFAKEAESDSSASPDDQAGSARRHAATENGWLSSKGTDCCVKKDPILPRKAQRNNTTTVSPAQRTSPRAAVPS